MIWIGGAALAAAVIVLIVVMATRGGDDEPEVTTENTALSNTSVASPSSTAAPDTTAAATTAPATTAPPETTEPERSEGEVLAASVVQIQLLLDGQVVCTGSGTILEEDGTILTNNHVIEQSPICPHDQIAIAVAATSQDVPEVTYVADLLVADPEIDLAVIRPASGIDGSPVDATFVPLPVGDSDSVSLGDRVRVIGYPGIGGQTVTFTEGSVSGFTTANGQTVFIKTDATIAGGNSGGLAADDAGTIVGVPTRAGSGDGRIVDCRIIADSNGDGTIDQSDTCVPIGGFINGIRPIALALPLIEAARTATPIDQGPPPLDEPMGDARPLVRDPQWSLGVTADGFAAEPILVAPAGAGELCLTWNYENVPEGSDFDTAWFYNGEFDPGPSVSGQTTGPDAGGFFACVSNPNGLADGTYEVAWVISGEPVFAESTFVGGNRPAIDIDVVDALDTDVCVVQFNAAGTQSFGLNELDAPIPAGGTARIPLGAGVYVARVIDCDGVIVFEDNQGTELSASTTLTVSPS
jgi:S1-C subfamily serine protease